MVKKSKKVVAVAEPKDKLLPKLTMAFFKRPRKTALLWAVIIIFGALSYTTFLKREGFPSINIPIVIVNGSYAVNDAGKVDQELAKRISEIALKQSDVSKVQTTSEDNFFSATVQYKEDVDAESARKKLEEAVNKAGVIPKSANVDFTAPYFGVTGGSLEKIDATISVFAKDNNQSTKELTATAEKVAEQLNKNKKSQIETFFVQTPFESVTNPVTQEQISIQRSFDRYAERDNESNNFYNSVLIGVTGVDGVDVLKLDTELKEAIAIVQKQEQLKDVRLEISASLAPSVDESISELQKVLLEGLAAVLIVGSIIIAFRASLIIVIAMITVIATTIGVLFALGYTLNVITLFGLILGLALIVDDTIIMTEAVDAARKRNKKAKDAVQQATRKISRAMVAATLTAALSFTPLLFVGGILGGFIRAIPVTIITALLTSLLVALIFIPLFARYLLLTKKQMGKGKVAGIATSIENKIADLVTRPMQWANHSRSKEVFVGMVAVLVGVGFIVAGGMIAKHVSFNIFPPTKDANQIAVTLKFPEGTTLDKAEQLTDIFDKQITSVVDQNFVKASYYNMATQQSASLNIDLVPYGERDIRASEISDKIKTKLEQNTDGVLVNVGQIDIGPPSSGFNVQIEAEERESAMALAKDVAKYLDGYELTRVDGKKSVIESSTVQSPTQYIRSDGKPVITVSSTFVDSDTSTLVALAKDAVTSEFNKDRLAQYGLPGDALSFDLGQEDENQSSFQSLVLAFPIVLLVIFVLLAVQFRSLLQPLLIFLAIPFSFFGISLGLYLSDNAFSFFAMLGFFALIGLSIKNTILLTDYANQARRSGMAPVEAVAEAVKERFRPLIATSLTAVVSLIPLAITSPFWEGLAVVLIGGLLSSTFLVVTVFPYYYLGAEYIRIKTSRAVARLRKR